MRHTYLLVLLGCALRPSPVGAQSPAPSGTAPSGTTPSGTAPFVPAPSVAAQNEARLKGAIWTTTAERAWQDLKLPPQSKQPERWNTPDDFEKWRERHAQNDRAGLIGLHDKVLKFAGQKSVSPAGLKAAILHEIGSLDYEGRHVDQQKLAEALNKVAPAAEVAKSVLPEPDLVAQDAGNASGPGNASADVPAATAQRTQTRSAALEAKADAPAFSWSLVVAGLTGFLLGLMGAAALRQFLRQRQTSAERQEARQQESERIKRYKAENKRLEQEMQELRKQNAQLQTKGRENTYPTPRPQNAPLTGPSVAPAVAEAAAPIPTHSLAPTAPPSTGRPKFYASAAPGGLLEHDKLAAQSMGRMALLVEPNGQNPQSARFTLNPDVDKSWLIAADLEKLRDYFTFTLPADRWPSSVEAAAPGTLTREGNGWKVEKKAALTVR